MNFLTTLLALLKALPALVKLLTEISAWMQHQFGDDPAKFLLDASETFKKAREAKTPQERRDAARDIATIIHRL